MLQHVLLVGLGGCLGSMARYITVGWVERLAITAAFPYGTLVVNVLGCLAIGFLGGLAGQKQFLSESTRLLLFTGILGGFTTFSAFGSETFYLLRTAQGGIALLNVGAQVILGLCATALGYYVSRVF